MSLVEGRSSFHTVGSARLIDDSRELAWAETHVKKAPDVAWCLGSYLQTSTAEAERANDNGHLFPLADLQDSIQHLPHRPLNLLHAPGRRIGVITAAEFVWPEGGETASAEPPIVEALAAVWKYYEPDLIPSLEMAHNEGQLFYSMEAVPKSLTCKGKGEYAGCGETFDYKGRTDPSYCSHLNEPRSRKLLNRPMMTAAALIIPPSRPGWKQASIKEISRLVDAEPEIAEQAYNQIATGFSHLTPRECERVMTWFMAAFEEDKK